MRAEVGIDLGTATPLSSSSEGGRPIIPNAEGAHV